MPRIVFGAANRPAGCLDVITIILDKALSGRSIRLSGQLRASLSCLIWRRDSQTQGSAFGRSQRRGTTRKRIYMKIRIVSAPARPVRRSFFTTVAVLTIFAASAVHAQAPAPAPAPAPAAPAPQPAPPPQPKPPAAAPKTPPSPPPAAPPP